jgi:four helix bundle protein
MTTDELYERLLTFAIKSHSLVKTLPNTTANKLYGTQLIKSSSSPGANYIEPNEAISPKDFIHRLTICRKETKESTHWLLFIQATKREIHPNAKEAEKLLKEAHELIKIFTASIITAKRNHKMENLEQSL